MEKKINCIQDVTEAGIVVFTAGKTYPVKDEGLNWTTTDDFGNE